MININKGLLSKFTIKQGTQLYKNSFFIIMTRLMVVGTGFIFWLLAARLYSINDVGIAVALISSATLLYQFSLLGFDYSIIRFISIYDNEKIFNTCTTLATIVSIALGLAYIGALDHISPELSFIRSPVYASIFLCLILVTTISTISGNIFIGLRKSEYSFLQNLILISRVPLLLPLMFFGAVGILMSNCVAYLFLCVFVFYSLRKMIGFNFYIDIEFIKKSFNFSSGNYIANILYNAIYTIPPIMVLNVLGDAEAAKYYIAFTIGTFFFQIPFSISTSLFVEGSYGESLRKNVIRSIKAIYMILVPAVIFILLFGQYFLSIFGKDYAGSVDLLRLISISSFFFAIYSVMVTIQNVKMNVKNIMILNLFLLVLLLALSYIFMSYFGIAGVGLAFLTTFIAVDIIIIAWAKAKKWI